MENVKLFNQGRVDRTGAFIAAELKTLLDRKNIDSDMSRRVREGCPDYRAGLTIGEGVLATLKALNLTAIVLLADMATLTREPGYDDEDEDKRDVA
jgi:hypothetical protein